METIIAPEETTKTVSREDILAFADQRLEETRKMKELGLVVGSGDFYPTGVHYPPITMYPDVEEEKFFETYEVPEDGKMDIYLHIPFCNKRCTFCHYPVQLGQFKKDEKDRYLDYYEREMDLTLKRLGLDKFKARTILVGGGTPTFLTLDQQRRFLDMCAERIDTSECTQYNYDVDPPSLIGDEGEKRLEMLAEYGVDRLTLGFQSLDDEVLRLMNRHHKSDASRESIRTCREVGMQLNIEFIFGFPGQTLDNWIPVIEEAVTMDVDEIQLYRLKVDAYGDYQGPVKNLIQKNPDCFVDNDEQIKMKAAAFAILEGNGFKENLRRVFSKKREHYSHYADNQCCQNRDEIGMGLTAFSSLGDRFGLNTQNWDEYYGNIDSGKLPINRGLVRNREEQIRWATVLPLKNRDIYKPRYKEVTGEEFGTVFKEKFDRLKAHGLVEETDDIVKLTTLGAFFADETVQQFEDPQYLPFPREAYGDGELNPYNDSDISLS